MNPASKDLEPDAEEPPSQRKPRRSVARPRVGLAASTTGTSGLPQLATLEFALPEAPPLPELAPAPTTRVRRLPRRFTDLSAIQVVVLHSLALGLERGCPQDLIADEETAQVARHVAEALEGEVGAVHLVPVWDDVVGAMRRFDPRTDVVFNLVESLGGRAFSEQDVPRQLRALGFLHTGASYQALRRSCNKLVTKRILEGAGLKTPLYQVFHRRVDRPVTVPLPAIVKPVAEGGSFGVTQDSLVENEAQLLERVGRCLDTYHQPALAEEYIAGREINVALWGNGHAEVLPISEVLFEWTDDPLHQFVTFNAKWMTESAEYRNTPVRCPASLTCDEQARLESAALRAFHAIGGKGFARVDFRLQDGEPYILEININPDLAPDAGFFRSASAAGHTYRSMVLTILKMALAARP